MARTAFDATKPDAATQGGTAAMTSCNANDKALRDNLISGQMEGFAFSQTVGTGSQSQPQYFFWKNGTTWIRATNTWQSGGSADGNLTQQVFDLSINSGTDYTTSPGGAIMTVGYTYTGSDLTATTGGGGMLAWILSKMAVLKKVISDLAAHIALTGTSVHGLGTMSTQAASSVAITGGTVDGATVGATTPAAGKFTRANEQFNTYTPGASASQALDWSKGGSVVTTNGTNALTFSNVPSSVIATHTVKVDKANAVTWPASVTWGAAGVPSLGAVALVVSLFSVDGGTTVYAVPVWNA